MNLFTLSLNLNGFPISKAQKHLREIKSIPAEEYAAYVEGKKREIVAYHLESNSFYKAFFNSEKFNGWEDVPVMTKADLQRPLEQRLSSGFTSKNVLVGKTSGSSGHPFIFAKDKFCHALSWAIFADRYAEYNIDFNRSLQARFYGIPLDRTGYYRERLKDFLSKRYRFPIFNLDNKTLEKILRKFEKKPFQYINGYTSSIVLFAKFLKNKNLILNQICPTLKLCIVTSEMLFEEDRLLLETQFNIPIVNEYGASETGLIAFENKGKEFLLNAEDLFIEILDENDHPLPCGEEGRIVISSLYNKAHPIIRYDIGDRGIMQSSNAKFPLLKKLTGRTNDIALLPSGKVVPGLTFYYVTKSIIEDDGEVKEFIVQQTGPKTFKFIYVGPVLASEKISAIESAVEKYLEKDLELEFENVAVLKRSKRGKLKQFEKLF